MSASPYIAEAGADNFDELVLKKSHEVPVVADFWAAWCAPCQMLMPLLAKLADEYQGKFFLAKINTDVEQALAVKYGIRSLPSVKIFRNGEAVDGFMGVQPEKTIHDIIDRYIARESDAMLCNALLAYREHRPDEAIDTLRQAMQVDPESDWVKVELARILINTSRLDEAGEVLNSISGDGKDNPDVQGMQGRLQFLRIAADSPSIETLRREVAANANDCEARYRLAAHHVREGEYAPAMEQMLEIVRRDRKFRDDAGRRGLLTLFTILGGKGDLVMEYRKRLSNIISS